MPMINLPDRRSLVQTMQPQLDLQQWWEQVISMPDVQVQVRLRGNNLYVLCETAGGKGPDQTLVRSRTIRALLKQPLAELLPPDTPEIYQVNLYGKVTGAARPAWMRVIYLSQIEEYAQKVKAARQTPVGSPIPMPAADGPTTSALAASNLQLAQQGLPEAIARHLSESLSQQGIAVRAGMKALWKDGKELTLRRLVIYCEAAYSPDPTGLIEPIAEQLRSLQLTTFRDAVVYGQVQGEVEPDWKLRIDLTPPTAMLREWARWGDLEAIVRLANQALTRQQWQVSGIVLDMVLHLTFWRPMSSGRAEFDVPAQQTVVRLMAALFESLAPQGIHALAMYGIGTPFPTPSPKLPAPEQPAWDARLNLPAAAQLSLSDPTEFSARHGDVTAIGFLLTRLLNPDLDRTLATGGVRIQARHRQDLLHVMIDAPQLPEEKRVVPLIAEFLRGLRVSGVNGVRLYGRRTGETQPRWKDGYDFASRDRLVPEATPEFAASEAFVGDLITQQTGSLLVRPDLNADEMRQIWTDWIAKLRQRLLATQIFAPLTNSRAVGKTTYDPTWVQDLRLAAVWGAMGILITVCADWGLGLVVPPKSQEPQQAISKPGKPPELSFAGVNLSKAARDGKTPTDLGAGGFTGGGGNAVVNQPGLGNLGAEGVTIGSNGKPLLAAPIQPRSAVETGQSDFNAPQLSEKLALYEQFVSQSGVPDVLIIGSSRAMRGLDPVALQEALAAQGYSGRKIFNFGINGATAQVADLVVRRLIAPEKLPKLILWADGARALNSGRVDVTYNAIATSSSFNQLALPPGESKPAVNLAALGNTSSFLAARYDQWNQFLNDGLAQKSAVYGQRSELVDWLWAGTAGKVFPVPADMSPEQLAALTVDENVNAIDVNGFLPMSVRFNPTTYYQKFARVTGPNDADYAAFQLMGGQTDALKNLVDYTKAKGRTLVFVNLPLTTEYLDADRRGHEDKFQQFMIQAAGTYGFTYRNLAEVWKTSHHDYFSDPSHLNRYGAYAVSQELAKDVMIPWGAQ